VITVCFKGEDPNNPARAGEYILEPDELQFFPDGPGRGHGWFCVTLPARGSIIYHMDPSVPPVAFSLRRARGEQN
jgi:hypothetical protein